jgi:hypothetical protein
VFGARGAEAALLIALAYIVQVQAAAWYVRLTDRLFGPPPAVAPDRECSSPPESSRSTRSTSTA